MGHANWAVSGKLTSKGQITLPKIVRTQLGIKEGDLISFTIEKNDRVYLEKINRRLLCPACQGRSLKNDEQEVSCVICGDKGLLYQSHEGDWLLLATDIAKHFNLQLNLQKTENQYCLYFDGIDKHPQKEPIMRCKQLIESQLNQYLTI